MTSEQWEEATEVDFVEAPLRDTEPAPAPSVPENEAPTLPPPASLICEICDGYGEHDAACPLCPAVAP